MTDYRPWTSRCVYFDPHPRTPRERLDRLFDELPERLWENPRGAARLLPTLPISCSSGVYCVGSWPWWAPAWWARRFVARAAWDCGVGGEATMVVERSVLARTEDDDDDEEDA